MTNRFLIALENAGNLDRIHLGNEDLLGFHISLFENIPFVESLSVPATGKPELLSGNILHWQHHMATEIGTDLCLDIWLIDSPVDLQQFDNRYLIGRIRKMDGSAVDVEKIISRFFDIESSGQFSFSNVVPADETTPVYNHKILFKEDTSTIWLSSDDLSEEDLQKISAGILPDDLPKNLKRGYQWTQELDLSIGQNLGDWFKNSLQGNKVRTIYNKEIQQPVITFELQLEQHQKSAHKNNGVNFQLQAIRVCFSAQQESAVFIGFGLSGQIDFSKDDQSVAQGKLLAFDGNLRLDNSLLDIELSDFPSINRILEIFGKPTEDEFLSGLVKDSIGKLYIKSVSLSLDIENFDVRSAALNIETKDSIKIIEEVQFYPSLNLSCEYPFKPEDRQFDLQVGGSANLFGAVFSASYHHLEKLFFVRLTRGELSSDKILEAFKFPPINGVDIRVTDIEFTAQKVEKQWTYEGQLTIGDGIEFDLGALKLTLANLHAEFRYAEKLEHFQVYCQLEIGTLLLDATLDYDPEIGYEMTTAVARPVPLDKLFDLLEIKDPKHNKGILDEFHSDLVIRRLMLNVLIGQAKRTPELEFVLAIDTDNTNPHKDWPFPLDHLYFSFKWSDKVEWEAIANFTFSHEYDFLGQITETTNLLLYSSRKNGVLRFEGSIRSFEIKHLVDFIEDRFQVVIKDGLPAGILNSSVENLGVALERDTKGNWKFDFNCDATIPLDGVDDNDNKILTTGLYFRIEKGNSANPGESNWMVSLEIDVKTDESDFNFNLTFHHENGINHLLVDLTLQKEIAVDALLRHFLPNDLPVPSMQLNLKEIYFAVYSNTNPENKKRNLLFGAELNAQVDLTKATFLEKILPAGTTTGVENFRLVYAKDNWTKEEISALSEFSKAMDHHLPLPQSDNEDLAGGFGISGNFKLGEWHQDFHISGGKPTEKQDKKVVEDTLGLTESTQPNSGALTKWFGVNKHLGPFHVQRLGIQLRLASELQFWILLDAGLEIAILSVSVNGLGIGSPLDKFEAELQLQGLGIDFKKGPLEIGGALLFAKGPTKDVVDLNGTFNLQFKSLGLSILASYYSDKDTSASILMYGNLNYPIGGPPFFFVTGLAAGIGINRKVIYPSIDEIATFPLISTVVNNDHGSAADQTEILKNLKEDIEIRPDQFFLAAGVRFNSFRIIDSMVLFILSFGQQFELDLLGISELAMPKMTGKGDPVAKATLMVHAAFRPAAGTLQVEARLDPKNSYLLSRQCHLQGGFAFYTWFKGDKPSEDGGKPGDFVLSLGGYHPRFNVPKHFPAVPRLGFNWELDKHMQFKGELYFALTPAFLMAGGMLQGNWSLDHLSASFHLGINMIIAWQPFSYSADALLNIKAGYHDGILQFDGELNAQIEIWGPEFGGTASLKVCLLTITGTFGAARNTKQTNLTWSDFRKTMLSGEQLINSRVTRGKSGSSETKGDFLGRVHPADFEVVIESQVPVETYHANKNEFKGKGNVFGIPAMGLDTVTSDFEILVKREGELTDAVVVSCELTNGPTALWGTEINKSLNAPKLKENMLFAFSLKPETGSRKLTGRGISSNGGNESQAQKFNPYQGKSPLFDPFSLNEPQPAQMSAEEITALMAHWKS